MPQEVVLRRLATSNEGDCQECDGTNLTECLLLTLPTNYHAINDLTTSTVLSID